MVRRINSFTCVSFWFYGESICAAPTLGDMTFCYFTLPPGIDLTAVSVCSRPATFGWQLRERSLCVVRGQDVIRLSALEVSVPNEYFSVLGVYINVIDKCEAR